MYLIPAVVLVVNIVFSALPKYVDQAQREEGRAHLLQMSEGHTWTVPWPILVTPELAS
jgi:hypothetical protein